ncbi:twitch domain-containing radical SAM protein [Halobacteriovorax sp. HLS]|uniref:twitch domain-containing radical SAM protein n=1 Tax=Halobacteriovorax sp. HLS TaxID=2234000 RepID=UPI000FDA244F|nr:twitch domain-containing radical SAM protein [Halobacteriovorax sp. HLS]
MTKICPLPWLHFSCNADSSLRLCCNATGDRDVIDNNGDPVLLTSNLSWKKVSNYNFYKDIRSKMLKGVVPEQCKNCYKLDNHGGKSPLSIYEKQFKESMSSLLDRTLESGEILSPSDTPEYCDLTYTNSCNLKCRMCTPELSAPLHKEWKSLNIDFNEDFYENAKNIWDLKLLKSLDFIENTSVLFIQGGEPLINKDIFNYLQELIEKNKASKIYLKITTNLTILSNDWIKVLCQFKGVAFHVSIEGTSELNNYIRFPSKLNQIEENIEKLIKLKRVYPFFVNIHTVFQFMNIHNIESFLKYLQKWKGQLPIIPTMGYLNVPEFYNPKHLEEAKKNMILSSLRNFLNDNKILYTQESGEVTKENFENLLGCIELASEKGCREMEKKALYYIEELDKLRDQSFVKVSNGR